MGGALKICMIILLGVLGACTQARSPQANLQPVPVVATETRVSVATQTIASTTVPTATASGTAPAQPQLVLYREPRGVFTLLLPDVWNKRSFPEGIGVSATAYNATARYILSLSWLTQPLGATELAQLTEDYKNSLFEPYLVQEPQISGTPIKQGYQLAGSATLTGTPTQVEITLTQSADGMVLLQAWLVPTPLWDEFKLVYKEPIEASLVVDQTALQSLIE